VEDDIFRIIIPLTEQVTEQATEQVAEQVKKLRKIIDFCKTPKSTAEIMEYLGLKHREHFRSKILQPLLAQGILAQTMPDAPRSPKQK
jgi:ATP-dependent DNA helicase RecG